MTKIVLSVDHGPQFGHEHWYLFYCPECSQSVSFEEHNGKPCPKCGTAIRWKTKAECEADNKKASE